MFNLVKIHKSKLKNVLFHLLVLSSVGIFMIPFIGMVYISLKPPKEIFTSTIGKLTLENYFYVFQQSNFGKYYLNSLIASGGAVLLSLILGLPAAYVLTRFNFKCKGIIEYLFLVSRLIPALTIIIPLFIMFRFLNFQDTYQGMIVAYTQLIVGFLIWMLREFFRNIPKEIEEAAMIDGCSRLDVFLKINIPLASTGIAAASILAFTFCWNDFIFALILTSANAKTATVAIFNYMQFEEIQWGPLMAAGICITLPIIIFSIMLQKYIIMGLTWGAVKG